MDRISNGICFILNIRRFVCFRRFFFIEIDIWFCIWRSKLMDKLPSWFLPILSLAENFELTFALK